MAMRGGALTGRPRPINEVGVRCPSHRTGVDIPKDVRDSMSVVEHPPRVVGNVRSKKVGMRDRKKTKSVRPCIQAGKVRRIGNKKPGRGRLREARQDAGREDWVQNSNFFVSVLYIISRISDYRKFLRARSPLYRSRFLHPNTHFSAFFEIYKIFTLLHRFHLQNPF